MSDRYRGRTTRQRNIADRVAREWAERRAAAEAAEQRVDLDAGSVEAEVELLDPGARPDAVPGAPGAAAIHARRTTRTAKAGQRASGTTRGPGRRVPDLSVLPRLLHETGSFATLRERLGPAAAPGMHGRHVGLTTVPHGAKSYLAAALALVRDGERICWVARDAEIGDRVAEELAAWLGDPDAGGGPGTPDVARLRALGAGPRRDGCAGRGASGMAGEQGSGAGRQRPGAAPGDAGPG